jgi:hypothetical protein
MTENQWQRENSKLAEAKRHVMYRETKRERWIQFSCQKQCKQEGSGTSLNHYKKKKGNINLEF